MADIGSTLSKYTSSAELSALLESDKFGIYSADTYLALDGVTDDYTALYNLINTTINGADAEIWFKDGTCLISSSITFPSNIRLVFLNGGIIKPDTGVTITGTSTMIDAGLSQIFDLSNGSIGGSWNVEATYPEWFGAVRDGATDDTIAIQSAINMLSSTGGSVKLQSGSYYYTALTIPAISPYKINLVGKGILNTVLKCYGNTSPSIDAIGTSPSRKYFSISGVYVRNYGGNAIDGIGISYSMPYSSIEESRFYGFQNNIKLYEIYGFQFYNNISTHALNDGLSVDTSNIQTAIRIIGGQYTNNSNYNIYISGRNHVITGVVFEKAGVIGLYAYFCLGINIDGYYEGSAESIGLKLDNCKAVSVNGFNVSNWLDNASTRIIDIYRCKGVSVSGFNVERSSNPQKNGTAIYIEDTTAFDLNGLYIEDIDRCIYIKNSNGKIGAIGSDNINTLIETFNHEFVRLFINSINRTDLALCNFGSANRISYFDFTGTEYALIDGQNTMLKNVGLTALPTPSSTYQGAIIQKTDTGKEDSLYVCQKTLGDEYINEEIKTSRYQSKAFEIFDDFIYQTISETDTPWIFNSGTDAQALDPSISIAERGVIILTTGDNSGTLADDGSQIICAIPVQADSENLTVETRLHINTAITNISLNFGLTDTTALEEPFEISGTTITSNATDAACFVYDDGATTKEWYACSVDSDVDDSGNSTTSIAPVADTFQTLRIESSSSGNTIKFYINGVLVKTLNNAGISPSTNLYATIIANSTTTTSKTVDIDYIYISHNR